MNRYIVIILAIVGTVLLSACANTPSTPENTLAPTLAGPGEQFSTAQPPAPSWRSPARSITRDNVFEIELLGRLDFNGTPSTIFNYAFSPDGTRIVGLNNTNVVGWDLITGQFVINNTHKNATRLFYSVDKTELYVVQRDGTVAIYSAETSVSDSSFMGHERFNGIVAYDPINGWLALGGIDGSVQVWDTLTRTALSVFTAHQGEVTQLVFSPDGTRLVSSGIDGTNYLWNWQNREIVHILNNENVPTIRIAYHPSGETIAIATNEVITMWDVPSGEFIHGLPTGVGGSDSLLLFSPNGKFLVNGGNIPDIMIWDAESDNHFVAYLPEMGQGRIAAAFSPDSELLITAKLEGETALWDMTQITDRTVLRANINPTSTRVVYVDWSPDAFTILFFDAGGSVYVWGLP